MGRRRAPARRSTSGRNGTAATNQGRSVTWAVIAIVGLLTWIAATLAISAYHRRGRRRSLTERLLPYHAPYIADEAEDWLHGRE